MAIYHFTVKIHARAHGRSVVAAAAYRSGQSLADQRYGLTHDYTAKAGIAHLEILAPAGSPSWVFNREALWNKVEAVEKRKDAQLARELEIALPVELTHEESVDLMRDYLKAHFVSKGMIADLSIHRDNSENPHAHVLLTMRKLVDNNFGPKERSWNAKSHLLTWRAAWAEATNEHLARAGHAIHIDHRSLEAQSLPLTPGRKIGIGPERHEDQRLPHRIAERIDEQQRIARENGEAILEDPTLALEALSRQRATFTERDIAKWLHTRTADAAQFDAARLKIMASIELKPLGADEHNQMRYTTRGMLDAERSLFERARKLDCRLGHEVATSRQASALKVAGTLTQEQQSAFIHLTRRGDLKAIVGVAGSGKSHLLAAARIAWEAEGFKVKGAALSGIAAENLELASGIQSRTLASYEFAWSANHDPLTSNDVLVIDEAGLIGTRQLERMLAAAEKARAKVVLVGDPEQLQAIEAGAAFRGVLGQAGWLELTQVKRQNAEWAREATQELSAGKTENALDAYAAHGALIATATNEAARATLLDRWDDARRTAPEQSRLMLAYTRDDVRALNLAARDRLKAEGQLRHGTHTLETTRGAREFASGDRILFLRNERSLGVKNGSLGTVESTQGGLLSVRLDDPEETRIAVDPRFYQDLEHGYATTIHKAQGSTVDQSFILASRHFDRHATYVALSRHRESAVLVYAEEDIGAPAAAPSSPADPSARAHFISLLSRARPKELAHDYLEPEFDPTSRAANPGHGAADAPHHYLDNGRAHPPPEVGRGLDDENAL